MCSSFSSWDDAYKKEIDNFESHGDEGEVWFGEEAMDRVFRWMEHNKVEKDNWILHPRSRIFLHFVVFKPPEHSVHFGLAKITPHHCFSGVVACKNCQMPFMYLSHNVMSVKQTIDGYWCIHRTLFTLLGC